MFEVDYATNLDLATWKNYDQHISEKELLTKINLSRAYILKKDNVQIGVMRYNLFWDSIPFLTMLYIDKSVRGKGYGQQAISHWEREMNLLGFSCVMTSTQSDETAQYFYRKLGYKDAGCLIINVAPIAQPSELFFIKKL